jgi:hypothetical protein
MVDCCIRAVTDMQCLFLFSCITNFRHYFKRLHKFSYLIQNSDMLMFDR